MSDDRAEQYRQHALSRMFVEDGESHPGDGRLVYETADEISQRVHGRSTDKYAPRVETRVTLTGDQMADLALLGDLTETSINDLIRRAVETMLFDARYDGAFDGDEG